MQNINSEVGGHISFQLGNTACNTLPSSSFEPVFSTAHLPFFKSSILFFISLNLLRGHDLNVQLVFITLNIHFCTEYAYSAPFEFPCNYQV